MRKAANDMDNLKNIANQALEALKTAGAEKAKCDVGFSETHEFNVDGGKFSLFRTLFDKHLVMTAIKAGKKGSVRQNCYDHETIVSAAEACLATAESSLPDEAWDIAPLGENRDFEYGAVKPDLDKFFFRCRELMDDISERYPKVIVEQMIMTHRETTSVHANTNGVVFGEHCGSYSVEIMFSAHEGELASSFSGSYFKTDNLDTRFIDCAGVAKDLADIEKQITTRTLDGKFSGVMILTPGCLREFLSFALGSFTGEVGLLEGTSPWKDKLGQQVADTSITVSDVPSDPRIICGEKVTADGFAAEDYSIIKDGILESFMISQYVANKTGFPRAKNTSGSIVMKNGGKPLDEIIAGIDKGIVVGRFSGGQPSSNGDFSGVAKNSFLVENGKITDALSETMISRNLADMLNSVYGISSETVADGSSVLPYAAFSGITVSGK